MFVGRNDELRELGAVIEAAKQRGSYVAVVGEPGIGKTRLGEEVSVLAAAAGLRVAWGRCWEAGGAPPFWPWIEAMRALDIAASWERAGAEQFEVFDGVTRALMQASEQQPLAIVLDDLHAADRSSLLLLAFVARQVRFMRVLLIATYRDVEARIRDDAAALLAKAAREGTTLALPRLDRAAVAQLAPADSKLVDAVYRASEGNPLFVHEVLQLVEAQGHVIAIPDGIRAVIAEHLRLVSASTRGVLDAASVIGRELDVPLLADLAGAPGSALAEAERAGLVVRLDERWRFSHVRIRDVLYDELASERRAALHIAAAEALERRAADPSAIAHHWFAAASHDTAVADAGTRAIAAAVRAADDANRRLAFDEAATLLERAYSTERDGARRVELEIALATALIRAGRHEDGQRHCIAAARNARALDAPELVARAALAYGLIYRFGRSDPTLVALLEQALSVLPAGDSPLRAQLLGRLAGALQPAEDLEEPVAAAQRALAMARRIGDRDTLASVLVSAGSALQDVIDAALRIPNNEELLTIARANDDPLLAARAHLRLVFDQLELGNTDAADAHQHAHEELIADHRNPRLHWPIALVRAMRANMAGRFAEADDHAETARRLAERAGDEAARIVALPMHRILTAFVRDTVEGLRDADRLIGEHTYHPKLVPVIRALVAVRFGRVDDARARCPEIREAPSFHREMAGGTLIAEIVAAAATAEHRELVFSDCRDAAANGRCGVWGMTGFSMFGPIARPLGAIAAALDRWDDAERLTSVAIEIAQRTHQLPALARTRYEWGTTLLARGRTADGRRWIDEARATAEQLGMTNLIARCTSFAPATVPVSAPVPDDTAAAPSPIALDRDGDTWVVRWKSEQVRVRDSRGLQMLADLVARAGEDVHVLDLSGAGAVDSGDAGEVLDRTAIDAYKKRLAVLADQIADAEDRNDARRAELLRFEREALEDEITRAVGLGGRQRRTGGAAERARSNVQRRLKAAIVQIEKLSPQLGEHLARSVRTGSFCTYVPRP